MGKKDKTVSIVIKNANTLNNVFSQNPVLSMLFCDKHGKAEMKTEEDLREIAPSKLYEEHLSVMCRLVRSSF